MNPTEKASQNGTLETHACPVCNSENALNEVHCKVCAWYFPLKGTPQFALELSRAKQQFQMVQSFNQVYQHMQIQSKVLEKMSFRLDGMETDMKRVKEQNFLIVNPEIGEEPDYPVLESIIAANELNTPEKRINWWNNLEEQWQKTFNASFFRKGEILDQPVDEELSQLLACPTLRIVGPRGTYPTISFELSNLSGVRQLTNLESLFITHCQLISLEGIEHLSKLKNLFCNSNKLTSINAVHYLKELVSLYINANQVSSIIPVKNLTKLETLYCCYNQLVNFHGLTPRHSEKLKEFVGLPNDQIIPKEIKRIEEGLKIKCKKG